MASATQFKSPPSKTVTLRPDPDILDFLARIDELMARLQPYQYGVLEALQRSCNEVPREIETAKPPQHQKDA